MCDSNKPSLIKYLEDALDFTSFQSINQLNDGLKIMGEKPEEIWGKISSQVADVTHTMGRPKKKKKGPKVNLKVQLDNLFFRRNKIVHRADLSSGKKHRGKEGQIKYDTVKRWIDSVKKTIIKMDSLI